MKVGIFGGTFDPVHFGHLRAAEEVREAYFLDKIYFVPAYIPPHKQYIKITDYDSRLKMLRAAIKGNRYLYVSDLEIKRKGVSYTIDTVRAFERHFEEIYFILGLDAFTEIDTWHDYPDLFYHTNFIVMERPNKLERNYYEVFPQDIKGSIKQYDIHTFEHKSGKKIQMYPVTQLDISSTQIRKYVLMGKSIRYLVPPAVERIIGEKLLYLNN